MTSPNASMRSYCFSPLVMVTTFGMEFVMAAYVLWRYQLDTFGRLAAATLVCLGTFQMAEYTICTMGPYKSSAVIGYVAITLLPPMGIHLASKLAEVHRGPTWFSYILAGVWSITFVVNPAVISAVACTGNYSILTLIPPLGELYGIYYFGLLLIGLGLARWGWQNRAGKVAEASKWLAVSYLVITIPTFLVNVVWQNSRSGIPSVMCGFALMYAVILTMRIMPLAGTERQLATSRHSWLSFR